MSIENKIKLAIKYNRIDNEAKGLISEIINEFEIKKYFERYQFTVDQISKSTTEKSNPKIWQLWLQGIDSAPVIVKKCMESVQKFTDGREIVVLDNTNIESYVSIPSYVYDKKKRGQISNVNFSDLLRSMLLAEHGGTWVDSTVLLTDAIPSKFIENSLFCFSTTPKEYRGLGNIVASSWFIHASANNPIMEAMRSMLLDYWKNENSARHHYYFHLFFKIVLERNELCKNEWERVPFFSNVPPHVLQMELFKQYNEERFNQIKGMSPIHKLTYYGGKEFDSNKKGTFYDKIVNIS